WGRASCGLGGPVGTFRSRRALGRARLRARLVRRGLAPAAALATGSKAAEASAAWIEPTTRAAARLAAGADLAAVATAPVAALAKGALDAMALSKLKAAGLAATILGALALGAAALGQPPAGRERTSPRVRYEIHTFKDGQEAGEPIVVDLNAGVTHRLQTDDA